MTRKISEADSDLVIPRTNRQLDGWLLAASLSILLIAAVLQYDESRDLVLLPGVGVPLPATCSSRVLTGISCPGCGLTRAFVALTKENWEAAWRLNPASYLVMALVLIQVPWRTIQLIRIARGQRRFSERGMLVLCAVTVAALLLQWLIRWAQL